MDYNSIFSTISVHKLYKSLQVFLCTFLPSQRSLSISQKKYTKKPGKTLPGF